MKVWILIEDSRCCGDFVVGVYGSPEKAQAVKDERRNPDDSIEERDLDERLDWRYGPVFRFEIDPLEGDLKTWNSRPSDEWRHPEQPIVEINGPVQYGDRHYWLRAESPISAEHAEHVAWARRDEWLKTREAT